MPEVPYTPYTTATPSSQGIGAHRINTPEASFGGNIGGALSNLGHAAEGAGTALFNEALKMQQQSNETALNDLYVGAEAEAGKLKAEYNSLEGKAAVDALPKYQSDLDGIRQRFSAQARQVNPEVARNFDRDFRRRVGYMSIDGGSYAASQNKAHMTAGYNARKSIAISDAANTAFDDKRFQVNLDNVLTTVKKEYEERGLSADDEQTQAALRKATAQVWEPRLLSMAKVNPLAARAALDKNEGSMDGLSVLSLRQKLDQEIIYRQSRIEADRIMGSFGPLGESYQKQIKEFEGYRDKPYFDHKQTSSGYGTKFVQGDELLPPEQLKVVHEQRFQSAIGRAAAIVDQVNPNLPEGTRAAMISLTYNAGDDWVRQGLGEKIRAGDLEGAKQNFAEYVNASGRVNSALVKRRASELDWWGQGETKDRGPLNASSAATRLAESMDEAKAVAERIFPSDPGNRQLFMDNLQSRIQTQFSQMKTTANMQRQANYMAVMSELVGDSKVTSMEMLSAQAQDALRMLDPQQQNAIARRMEVIAKGGRAETPDRIFRFSKVMEAADRDPGYLQSLTPDEIVSLDLTNGQMKQVLAKMRGQIVDSTDEVNVIKAMRKVNGLLNDYNIWPSHTDKEANRKYELIGGTLGVEMRRYKAEHKKEMPEEDVRKFVVDLLDPRKGSGWGPFDWGQKPVYEIPDNARGEIVKSLKNYNIDPSEKNVMDAWFKYLQRQKGGK